MRTVPFLPRRISGPHPRMGLPTLLSLLSYMGRSAPPVSAAAPLKVVGSQISLDATKIASPLTLGGGILSASPYPLDFLGSATLAANAQGITISNLPARDILVLWWHLLTFTAGVQSIEILLNGDTGANYTYFIQIVASGVAQQEQGGVNSLLIVSGVALYSEVGANESVAEIEFGNQATVNKEYSGREANDTGATLLDWGSWANTTDRITSITVQQHVAGHLLDAGSRIMVFGKNA